MTKTEIELAAVAGGVLILGAWIMAKGTASVGASLGKGIADAGIGAAVGVGSAVYTATRQAGQSVYDGMNAVAANATGQPEGSVSIGAKIWEFFNPSAVEAERRALGPTPSIPRFDAGNGSGW